jgi:7-carboxy-7-deazaguanine synthase
MSESLYVSEIFHSLQGESVYAGLPCTFIRLAGCNLNCKWCDTGFALKKQDGNLMSIGGIIEKASAFQCKLIEITGGEPLFQNSTPALIDNLIEKGNIVLIETNGSLDVSKLNKSCIKIIDVKCPSSGESNKFLFSNFACMNPIDQIKFVIADKTDFNFAMDITEKYLTKVLPGNILFSPVTTCIEPSLLAGWIMEKKMNVRFHIQLHKFIWPDIERGV